MAYPETDQRRRPRHPNQMSLKSLMFYISCILVLILAIAFNLKTLDHYRTQILKATLVLHDTIFDRFQDLAHPRVKLKQKQKQKQKQAPRAIPRPKFRSGSPYCVLWMAPFLSGGGYSSEAWSYVLALHEHNKNPSFQLAIDHHGDEESLDFWEGLPENVRALGQELHETDCRMNETVVVCHSEPGAWHPPLFQTVPCPPSDYDDFMSVIGRTMFETDRVNAKHVKRCNQMDFVWVPSEFHVSTFVESGVEPSKIVKIVQPVDVNFFDPSMYKPLDLGSLGELVLGTASKDRNLMTKDFVFLSIFKWEYRKGWDVLIKAYLQEFSKADGVSLYLLTNPYHSDRNFGNKILEFVEDTDIKKPISGWAAVYVIDTHISQADLPRLYKAADSFVLSSRGEGWGRPIVEAMAMALPVIVTNWSGPTEYLREENAYMLSVDKMSEVKGGPFEGHFWAEPSVHKLQALMRHVMSNTEEAKTKGRQARDDMIDRFSPEIVAKIVGDQIESILNKRN